LLAMPTVGQQSYMTGGDRRYPSRIWNAFTIEVLGDLLVEHDIVLFRARSSITALS
jgi:hypothetical protein